MLAEETLRVENFKIKNFRRLGCTSYVAILCIELGIDWHDLENLLGRGCELTTALDILRPL